MAKKTKKQTPEQKEKARVKLAKELANLNKMLDKERMKFSKVEKQLVKAQGVLERQLAKMTPKAPAPQPEPPENENNGSAVGAES